MAAYENDNTSPDIQYFHDVCVVRTLEVQGQALDAGDHGQLGNRVCRVLLPGARQPHRSLPMGRGAVENDPGGDHPRRFFILLNFIPGRGAEVELHRGIHVHSGRGLFRVL